MKFLLVASIVSLLALGACSAGGSSAAASVACTQAKTQLAAAQAVVTSLVADGKSGNTLVEAQLAVTTADALVAAECAAVAPAAS